MRGFLLLLLPCAFSDEAKDMHQAVNNARGLARMCGQSYFWPAKELEWDMSLHKAAASHAQDMVARGYFSHQAPPPQSSSPCERAEAHGWNGPSACMENIAAGQMTVKQAMDGLLTSPGHCANIMSPGSAKLGVGVAAGCAYGKYWVQHFGPEDVVNASTP